MPGHLSKEDITNELRQVADELVSFCSKISDKEFYYQPAEKWSIVQNITHLSTSTLRTALAFKLPKFILRLYVGKPNRPSRSYEELVAKYTQKLEQGGKASGRFVPKTVPMPPVTEKTAIIGAFSTYMYRLADIVEKKWDNLQLDQYIAPHPLLGKITLRELCYFTIYHTQHHQQIISRMLNK